MYDYLGIDFHNPKEVGHLIEDIQPELIINAKTYTAMDQSEQEAEKAFNIKGNYRISKKIE